jgi:cob(I)alamin adenosyltransferase
MLSYRAMIRPNGPGLNHKELNMSVTTGRGDSGWTDLLFGGRVRKDSPRVHAVGTLDELNSLLGLAKASIRDGKTRRMIHAVQRDIFVVGSELITLPRNLRRLELRVRDADVKRLEAWTSAIERKVKLTGCCFLIPGESATSALLDVCRTVARRAERLVVTLRRARAVPNRSVPVYLNRLSDLLYMMARTEERSHTPFIARKRNRRRPAKATAKTHKLSEGDGRG